MPRDCEGLNRSIRPAETADVLKVTEVKSQSGYGVRCLQSAWDTNPYATLVCVEPGTKLFVMDLPEGWDDSDEVIYDVTANADRFPFIEGLAFKRRGYVSLQDCPVDMRLLVRA